MSGRRVHSSRPANGSSVPALGRWALLFVALALQSLLSQGCISIRPVVVDRKTELENQLLGSFPRLEPELVLASSVRGEAEGKQLSPLEREAVQALMNREFNRDDIQELKQQRIVGEGNRGLLVLLRSPDTPDLERWAKELVAQENEDRLVIMRRVVQLDERLEQKDMPLVRRAFYRLNAQSAQPGELVQQADGSWQVARGRASAAQSPGAAR